MIKKLKGTVIKFGKKNYGFILSDDGEKYFIHQKNIQNEKKLKLDARVSFIPQVLEKGLIALEVSTIKLEIVSTKPLDKSIIKAMFLFLLLMHIITFYYLFTG